MPRHIGLSLATISVLMPLTLLGVLGLAAVVLAIADRVHAGRTRALTTSPRTAFAQTVALGLSV
jgi:cation-transporting ATPase G